MPRFNCQPSVLFRTLRVGCALSVFAIVWLSQANAATPSLPSCSWRLETDGTGITNVAYPDTDATYWTMPVDTTQWTHVIIRGQYPQARFFSFTTYLAEGAAADSILDVNINPDVGSGNPFRQGSSGQQHNYIINIGGPDAHTNHVNFGDTPLAWIIYRIYLPNKGLDQMAGVPLPGVTLVDASGRNHSIAPCTTPRDEQVTRLIGDLRADNLDDLADYWQTKFKEGDDGGLSPDSSCQPENQVVFWIPENTGGYFPNPYNKYIAGPALCFDPGKFVIVRGKAADFPDTYNHNPVWQPAFPGDIQLRYWSMCNNEQMAPFPVVPPCQPDYATNLDSQGYYTYVLGQGDSPPSWLPADATWLPWGSTTVSNILIFRNMLPTFPPFVRSVQAAIEAKCVVDNKPHTAPRRDKVVAAGACAKRVMGEYYPQATFCDESVFMNGGWQACFTE